VLEILYFVVLLRLTLVSLLAFNVCAPSREILAATARKRIVLPVIRILLEINFYDPWFLIFILRTKFNL
jgi:hypothetical protein